MGTATLDRIEEATEVAVPEVEVTVGGLAASESRPVVDGEGATASARAWNAQAQVD